MMSRFKKNLFSFGAALAVFSNLYPTQPCFSKVQPTAQNAQKPLRVCSQAGFVPFEMRDEKGNWNGFDIDLVTLFSQQQKRPLVMVDTTLDGLIPALMAQKCDLIASGLTITPERKKAVSFSDPVFTIVITAAGLDTPDKHKKFKTFASLDSPDVRLASHTGSHASLYLKRTFHHAILLQFNSESDEVNAIMQKKADFFVDDSVFITQVSKSMGIQFYTLPSTEHGELALAARKNDHELINQFNSFLDGLKKSGQLSELHKKYFGN